MKSSINRAGKQAIKDLANEKTRFNLLFSKKNSNNNAFKNLTPQIEKGSP